MLRNRPLFLGLVLAGVALIGALAVLQVSRHGLQAAPREVTRPTVMACAPEAGGVAPARVTSAAANESPVTFSVDYAGADALLRALERDSLSDADVDSLFRIRGLCAMVDNVARFVPGIGAPEFREEIRAFVRRRKGGRYDGYFDLSGVWQARSRIRATMSTILAHEQRMAREAMSQVEPYRPDTGSLSITVHFVAGGVSDGFVFDDDRASFYANLARGSGELDGIVLNLAHEAYHVMQFNALAQAGLAPSSASPDASQPVERLFATTLAEGAANYVVDPGRWASAGASMDSARQRYRRNAEPARVADNFARFDAVLAGLTTSRMSWDEAYEQGFTSANDASFYFVGYEMMRAIDSRCGHDCTRQLFREPPVAFFRQYVALYRAHPEIRGRFSAATEAVIAGYAADRRTSGAGSESRANPAGAPPPSP